MATSEIISVSVAMIGLTVTVISTIKVYQITKKDALNKINKRKSLLNSDKQFRAAH